MIIPGMQKLRRKAGSFKVSRTLGISLLACAIVIGTIASIFSFSASAENGYSWSNASDGNPVSYQWNGLATSAGATQVVGVMQGSYPVISTDSGSTWNISANGLPSLEQSNNYVAVASSSDGHDLVVSSLNGIYRSADSGASWSALPNAPESMYFLASSASGSILVAAGEYGTDMYVSTDSGANWTDETAVSGQQWDSVTISADGNTIIGASQTGLYVSSNAGGNWTAATGIPAGGWGFVTASTDGSVLLASKASNSALYLSKNHGATWQTTGGSDVWTSIASSSDGQKLVATNGSSDIYASSNTGTSWTKISSTVAPGGNGRLRLLVSSVDGSHLYAAGGSVYSSSDAGATWVTRNISGLRNWQGLVGSSDGTKLVAFAGDYSTDKEFSYTSSDSGTTWTPHNLGISSNVGLIAETASSDGAKMYFTTSGNGFFASTDSGATWIKQVGAPNISLLSASSDGTLLIGATSTTIYRSTNSGATWNALSSSPNISGTQWTSVASSPDGQTLAAATGGEYVYISHDAGVTWTPQTSIGPAGWYQLAIVNNGNKIIANGSGGLYVSVDAGDTWGAPSTAGPGQNLQVSSDGTKLVGTGADGIFTSIDGGQTWTEQSNTRQEWNNLFMASDGATIFAVGTDTTIWKGAFAVVPASPPVSFGVNSTAYTTADIYWSAPQDNGGGSITDYKIEYSANSGVSWSTFIHAPSTGTTATVTGLSPSQSYVFRVSAVTDAGVSDGATTYGKTADLPAPGNITTTPSDGSVALSWVAPSFGGVASLTGYSVQYKQISAANWTTASSGISAGATSYTVAGLNNGVAYDFRVSAHTSLGDTVWGGTVTTMQTTLPYGVFLYQIISNADSTKLIAEGYSANDSAGVLYASTDQGANWQPIQTTGMPSPDGFCQIAGSANLSVVVAIDCNNSNVYVSTDQGVTWTETSSTNDWYGLAVRGDGSVVYGIDGSSSIVSSTDSGQSKTVLLAATGTDTYSSVAASGSKLFALDYKSVGQSGAYTSTLIESSDGGATWQTLQTAASNLVNSSAYISNVGTTMVLGQYNSQDNSPNNVVSWDGGVTWNMLDANVSTDSLSIIGNDIYAADYSGDSSVLRALSVLSATPQGSISSSRYLNGQPLTSGAVIASEPVFSGYTQPHNTITVTIHSDPITCTTTADGTGFWSCAFDTTIPAGAHEIYIADRSASDGTTQTFGPYSATVPATITPAAVTSTSDNASAAAKSPQAKSQASDNTAIADTQPSAVTSPVSPAVSSESSTPTKTTTTPKTTPAPFNWFIAAVLAIAAVIVIAVVLIRKHRRLSGTV